MLSNQDQEEILDPSLHSTGSVSYGPSSSLASQGSHSEVDPETPMCQRCDWEKYKKFQGVLYCAFEWLGALGR
jgi:hypothetical protein